MQAVAYLDPPATHFQHNPNMSIASYLRSIVLCLLYYHATLHRNIPVDFPPLDLAPYPHQQWKIISRLPVYFSYYSQICSSYPWDFHSHCSWLGFSLGVCCARELCIVLYLIISFD